MRIHDLVFRFLDRGISGDGQALAEYSAQAGATQTFPCEDLPSTPSGTLIGWRSGKNAGRWSNIADFSSPMVTLDDPVPYAVEGSDSFVIVFGGLHVASDRVPGLQASALVNITGFDIVHADGANGEGTGTLRYDPDANAMLWTPPNGVEGNPTTLADLSEGGTVGVYGGGATVAELSRHIVLQRNSAAVPDAGTSDDVSLDLVPNGFLARITGAQAASGATIFRPVGLENTAGGQVDDVVAWIGAVAEGASSSTLLAAIVGSGAASLSAEDLTAWPASGWVYNSTKGDVRYYYDRSGNTATIADPASGHRGFTPQAWDVDDVLEPYPWFDIGVDTADPTMGETYADPSALTEAPSSVDAFVCPRTVEEALALGDLQAGGFLVLWIRIEIPAGARPLEGGRMELRVHAQVTETE